MSLRIALADDQALVRSGLRSLLESRGIEVLIEAENGEQLLAALSGCEVDVVVSDVRMPICDGIELVRRLRAAGSSLPVIVLTTFEDNEVLLRAVEAGAQGFLLKDASPEDLHDAIAGAAAGQGWLAPVNTGAVRERYAYRDQSPPLQTFSEREVAILRLMAGGYSNKEIARSQFLAEGTVKNYVSEILAKLDCRDRTRAVLKAITLQII